MRKERVKIENGTHVIEVKMGVLSLYFNGYAPWAASGFSLNTLSLHNVFQLAAVPFILLLIPASSLPGLDSLNEIFIPTVADTSTLVFFSLLSFLKMFSDL